MRNQEALRMAVLVALFLIGTVCLSCVCIRCYAFNALPSESYLGFVQSLVLEYADVAASSNAAPISRLYGNGWF